MSVTASHEPRWSAGAGHAPAGPLLSSLVSSWQLALEAAGKSPKTVRSYTDSAKSLCAFLAAQSLPADVESVDAQHLRAFLRSEEKRTSAVSAAVHYRNVRVFFTWLASEEERSAPNPMGRVDRPEVIKKAKPFFDDDDLARLLRTCQGSSFEDRRDTALIRILIDTGMRVSSLAGLRYDPDDDNAGDVVLAQRRLRIRPNDADEFWVPVGSKSAAAIDRYIRMRARHPHAGSPWLWLGTSGRNVGHMTDSGIRAMVKRRGEQAGISNVHPHRFRRSFADKWLAGGGSVDDLMHITGWKTYDMVREYTGTRGASRAHQAHARLSPGDRI
jgi:site-specific recombinase XerD